MNRKEVAEIKKNCKSDCYRFTLNRVVVCIVDAEGNIKYTDNKSGALLDSREEDMYFTIIRSVLNTKVGKNFLQYDIDTTESADTFNILRAARDTNLNSDQAVHDYLSNIITGYGADSPYAIVTAHCTYNVRKKNKNDEIDEFDQDEFNYLITAICPVISVDAGFSFNYQTGEYSTECDARLYMQPKPTQGFMYPAFDNRSANISSVMYYCKKAEDADVSFIEYVLGGCCSMFAEAEKQWFQYIIQEIFKEKANYTFMYTLNELLCEAAGQYEDDTYLHKADLNEFLDILEPMFDNDEEKNKFKSLYTMCVGESKLTLSNLIDTKFTIKAAEYTISFSKNAGNKVSTIISDGARSIQLKVEEPKIEMNGTSVNL